MEWKIEGYGYRCVKMEKMFKTRKVSLLLLLIVGVELNVFRTVSFLLLLVHIISKL